MKNDIKQELSTNFIEYAVAVNTDRAIPDARSGLKPVARRILWGAFKEGRISSKPHVKAARVVGDVMGSLHPHGDSSIYGALVRLSQNWIMRYPLMEIHGNNGNIAGDGAAHMRYTETRLAKLSEEGMLNNIKKKNVDFIPNYDETEEEPSTLPSAFPNLLCNPNTGIGVAMACSWLPHNLGEVSAAIINYIDGNEYSLPGPDFPTGGVIINSKEIPKIMQTGHGSVKVRGRFKIEKQKIIFYEIPYGTTIEALLAEIGEACDKQEIEGISEVRDESNKKGLRIVIECEKTANPDAVVNKLFAKTDLQSSISYNQVALVDKTPTELNLEDCLRIYVEHNLSCIVREADYDLAKAAGRLQIVNGLIRALEDIDNIIALIKASKSAVAAKDNLITKYQFTESQARAIVEMKLGKLAGLEQVELNKEKDALENEIKQLYALLLNDSIQKNVLKERLNELVKKYGDARRTELTNIEIPKEEKEIEAVIPEDVVVILTENGDIKRIPKTSFKTQRRNGKGVKNEDDAVLETISTNTIDNLMFFTTKGKMYKLLVDNVPIGTNASKGARISTLIKLADDERVIAMTSLYRQSNAEYVIFITKKGMIKKTFLNEYTKVKKGTGILALNLKEGDELANVTFIKDEELILITKEGMSIHFPTDEIAPIGRVAMGVKSMKLADDDEIIIGLPLHKNTDTLAIVTERGYGKKIPLAEMPLQCRAGKGVMIYKPTAVTGKVIGAAMVDEKDSMLLLGKPNSICISASDMPLLNRTSMGNIMIKDSIVNKIMKL